MLKLFRYLFFISLFFIFFNNNVNAQECSTDADCGKFPGLTYCDIKIPSVKGTCVLKDSGAPGGTSQESSGGESSSSGDNGVVKLPNPLAKGGVNSVQQLIGKVIEAVLGVVGSLALIMFIYGGITWMTAAGNEQSVTKGKNIVMWAALGLVVIFSSYALVKFVIQAIGA